MAIRIKARSGESVEGMMRRFKKLCEKEGLTKDIKRKEFYEKPSERRRRAARPSWKPNNRSGGWPLQPALTLTGRLLGLFRTLGPVKTILAAILIAAAAALSLPAPASAQPTTPAEAMRQVTPGQAAGAHR